MKKHVVACSALIVGLSGSAVATMGPVFNSPNLPPLDGSYVGQFHSWAGGLFNLSDPIHSGFTNNMPPPPPGQTQIHLAGSTVSGNLVVGMLPPVPVSASGPMTVRVSHIGDLGPMMIFETELLQLDLASTGPATFLIRESPTLPSLGRTEITDLGGGIWQIDSFFDVFTDLSIDGGATWIPSDGPTRMKLIPTPGAVALIGAGMLAGAARRRRG